MDGLAHLPARPVSVFITPVWPNQAVIAIPVLVTLNPIVVLTVVDAIPKCHVAITDKPPVMFIAVASAMDRIAAALDCAYFGLSHSIAP